MPMMAVENTRDLNFSPRITGNQGTLSPRKIVFSWGERFAVQKRMVLPKNIYNTKSHYACLDTTKICLLSFSSKVLGA